jgi:UrcA family protein
MSTLKVTRRSAPWTATLASAACLLTVGAASAAEALVTHITVSCRDLDLSTAAGTQTLYIRIQRAAGEVCDHPGHLEPQYDYLERAIRLCRQQAIADAVANVHSPLLTALYNKSPPKLIAMSQ